MKLNGIEYTKPLVKRLQELIMITRDLYLAKLWYDTNSNSFKPGKWEHIDEAKQPLNNYFHRSQLTKELIIELDLDTYISNFNFYMLNLRPKLNQNQINYQVFSTQSKSVHIHIFFNQELTNSDRISWLIDQFGKDNLKDWIKSGAIDPAFFTKDRQLVALEFQKHYKSKKPKILISKHGDKLINSFKLYNDYTDSDFNYVLDDVHISNCSNHSSGSGSSSSRGYSRPDPSKFRKVVYEYWDILNNPDAREQERVSCIMQIHNRFKRWSQDDVYQFVCRYAHWSDFDPSITEQKINYVWKYTKK